MRITDIGSFFLFMVNCVLCNNFIFSRFLGCCPFLGVSSKVQTATGMGLAVTFVMGIASLVTYFVNLLLVALGLEYLQTIAFILVIAALAVPVLRAGHLSAPDHHQLRGAGRHHHERGKPLQPL